MDEEVWMVIRITVEAILAFVGGTGGLLAILRWWQQSKNKSKDWEVEERNWVHKYQREYIKDLRDELKSVKEQLAKEVAERVRIQMQLGDCEQCPTKQSTNSQPPKA